MVNDDANRTRYYLHLERRHSELNIIAKSSSDAQAILLVALYSLIDLN